MNNNDIAQDELQQAINNITNASTNQSSSADVVADIENSVSGGINVPMPDFPAPAAPAIDVPTPEESKAENKGDKKVDENAAPAIITNSGDRANYGDPDLDNVRSKALSDIRPILDKIEMSPEKKFAIYQDIIDALDDKASFEPAYAVAGKIANEKVRAEALLYIIEKIDEMGLKKQD